MLGIRLCRLEMQICSRGKVNPFVGKLRAAGSSDWEQAMGGKGKDARGWRGLGWVTIWKHVW